jgi:Uma2 family endonuclease
MQLPTHHHPASIAEYLRYENTALNKHEYRDGEIVAMAGNSFSHSLIAINFGSELRNKLKGKPCRVLDSNLRVAITGTPLYTYPDISVICGKAQMDPNDSAQQTATNPRVLVEILSPSTEAYDRGEKFNRYQRLQSLEEYVLISQTVPRIEVFHRQADGKWMFTSVSGLENCVRLASVQVEIALAEVYVGVEFSDPPPEP